MILSELIYVLSTTYGWDIAKKTRKREVVYARKVYCKIASDMGYGPSAIGSALGISHDLAIHHRDTFNVVMPRDIMAYNACIDYFNLPLNKISGINELRHGPMLAEVLEQASKFNSKDLRYFIDVIMSNYKKKLMIEKKIQGMGKV